MSLQRTLLKKSLIIGHKKKGGRTSNDASDAEKQVAVEEPEETMRDGRHHSPDDSEVET